CGDLSPLSSWIVVWSSAFRRPRKRGTPSKSDDSAHSKFGVGDLSPLSSWIVVWSSAFRRPRKRGTPNKSGALQNHNTALNLLRFTSQCYKTRRPPLVIAALIQTG